MSILADTSAFYALLVRSEDTHEAVTRAFASLVNLDRPIWTTSFIVVETMALLQHRIGLEAARTFDEEIVPVIRIVWVDASLYRRAIDRLWREDRRKLSLVDCVSFEFMKQHGITTALAVDAHFEDAGFDVVPA